MADRVDISRLPPAGRIIRNADASFPQHMHTYLSVKQMLENQKRSASTGDNAHSRPSSEDFLWTANANVELPIRLTDAGIASFPPQTIVETFAEIVCKCSSLPALSYKAAPGNKKWSFYTWQTYWTEVCRFAKSLLAIGFPERGRTVVMGFNSPAWFISFFGTIFANGISGGIYATNSWEATAYIVHQSEAFVAVVDTRQNLDKVVKAKAASKSGLPKTIVIYQEDPPEGYESQGILKWDDFLALGTNAADIQLTQRMEAQRPGNCCSLVYTSGTTGTPKAVMLSHDNYCWTGWVTTQMVQLNVDDRIVSYLPLSHIASQILDMFIHLFCGGCVYFAKPDALQGSLVDTLRQVRPTWFFAVPRVWEKFEEKLKEVGAQNSGLTKSIAEWAKRVGFAGTIGEVSTGQVAPFGYGVAKKLILNKIREALGLDQCKAYGTGAAPLPTSTQEYFISLGVPICDLYGLSETTGPMTVTMPVPGWYRMGSIGHTMPGSEVMIHNANGDGVGELCFRGRNVFMGYLGNAESIMQSLDENGFLHTGDVGYIDDDGFIFVTGRIKELIITAGGENVAPVLLEAIVNEEMPFVSNCQVVGDRRKFLSLLVCLKSVPDGESKPTNNLAEATVKLLGSRGSNCRTTYEAAKDPVMNQLIYEGIKRCNKRCPSRAQHIRKWRIVPQDFTQEGGELTPTLKLKRGFVIEKYIQLIEDMYKENIGSTDMEGDVISAEPESKL